MYRYSGCVWPFPHRITGDGYQMLMDQLGSLPEAQREPQQIWDDEDVEQLVTMYRKNLTFNFIADVLDRPVDGIRDKVRALRKAGVLPYRGKVAKILAEKRKQYLRRNYPKFGLEYCARHLGYTLGTTELYVQQMGLVA